MRTYCAYGSGGFGGGTSQHGYCGYGAGSGVYTDRSASSNDCTQDGGGVSYFEGFCDNELSESNFGCNVSLPTNPGTNGNGLNIAQKKKNEERRRLENQIWNWSAVK